MSGGPHGTPRSEVMCEAPSPASLTFVGDRVCLYVGRYVLRVSGLIIIGVHSMGCAKLTGMGW